MRGIRKQDLFWDSRKFSYYINDTGDLQDFEGVITVEPDAPKSTFPFYDLDG